MANPNPSITSLDGTTVLALASLTRGEDPRMDEARFILTGPELTAESVVDAYLLDELFGELTALTSGTVPHASFGLGELEFTRERDASIRVVLRGGTYVGGSRTWFCGFAAAEHQVVGFAAALKEAWLAAAV